ncbi:leucyl/phenylalanyl-tRNA--protein transferase [Spongorhabdus nitratireducens]
MTFITQLDPHQIIFPHPTEALDDPNGLLAIGGNLEVPTLLQAYQQGIFPWFSEDDPILWWSPAPRMVIRPADMHVSRSLRKLIRQGRYKVSFDRAFADVIYHCATCRPEGTWITEEMQQAYINLHQAGYAHSVEIWQDDELVGGLYGIALGRMFFGESMFSLAPNSSKLAFYHLTSLLQTLDIELVDCQMETDHLRSLGADNMDRTEFLHQLDQYCKPPFLSGKWCDHSPAGSN